jgi:putative ABC transport system permease protein
VRGRLFEARDVEGRMPVAIVNEAAARRLWPSEDPVGRRFKIGPATSPDPWMSVVGVVTNSAMPIRAGLGMSLTHDGQTDVSLMYRPLAQSAGEAFGELVIAARVGAKAEGHAGPVRAAIRDGLSLERVPYPTTLRAWMSGDQTIERVRVTAGLLGAFAATALALALMGVYSVVAETVKRRRAELGIRMALGARAGSVVFIVLKDALRVTGAGLLVGVIGAVLAARVGETTLYGNAFARTGMRTGLLYGVDALNPALLIGACTVVLLVAALGGLLPARSATRVDPAETLRQE